MILKWNKKMHHIWLFSLLFILLFSKHAFATMTYLTSYSVKDGGPLRIAADNEGNIYTTTQSLSTGNLWSVRNGNVSDVYIKGEQGYVGVAVDRLKRIYMSNYKKGSVSVYSPSGEVLFHLGRGEGEFLYPNDIVIDRRGFVYVTDSLDNSVKVYSREGQFQFRFGGRGSADGQMLFPTGIAIDEFSKEVYVADQANYRIQVFDLEGRYKRKFTSSRLLKIQGLAVSNGKVYVVDAYHSSVKIFNTTGTYISAIGVFGTNPGQFIVPMDAVISNGRLLVTNSENERVEVFNLNEPNLRISHSELSFKIYENSSPSSQTVRVESDRVGTNVQWTAIVDASFPVTISSTAGVTPSDITISVNTLGMSPGNYTGKVLLYSNGTEYPININLTIKELPRLVVNPSEISFNYLRGKEFSTAFLKITSTSDELTWSANSDVSWITLSSSSGVTPSYITITLNGTVSTLSTGTYYGTVLITSAGAVNGSVSIPITLQVKTGGNILVKTNLQEATFRLTGPNTYEGSGLNWNIEDVEPGEYEITFGEVQGYKTPASKQFIVNVGETSTIDVLYEINLKNTIIVGKSSHRRNDGALRIFDINGILLNEIMAFDSKYGVNIAVADLRGDGYDEIIVAPGYSSTNRAILKIIDGSGTVIASKELINRTNGAIVKAGDLDGDGKIEIIVSTIMPLADGNRVNVVEVYAYNEGNIDIKWNIYNSLNKNGLKLLPIAIGDINNDGKAEVIIFDSGNVLIYGINVDYSSYLIAKSTLYTTNSVGTQVMINDANIAIGDIDGDGMAEIIVGYVDSSAQSRVKFYQSNFVQVGREFNLYTNSTTAPSVDAHDIDGDGRVEILVGKGPSALSSDNKNRRMTLSDSATLKIISADGIVLKEIGSFNPVNTNGVNGVFGFMNR